MKKLSFNELYNLMHEDKKAYFEYLNNCSDSELINYAVDGLMEINDDVEYMNKKLSKTLNKINLDNFYHKHGDSIDNHVN